MKSITELLKLEKQGKPLTAKEKAYLKNYKNLKRVKHSTNFIAHVRKLPEE